MSVIDLHVHVMDLENLQPWAREYLSRLMASPELLVEMLHENGAEYAVVLTEIGAVTSGSISNETIAEFRRGQETLVPLASIKPFTVVNPAQELERYVLEMRFEGLKLYPTYQGFHANDSMVYPLYAKAEEPKIPVVIHTGPPIFAGARLRYGDPLWLDDVAVCRSATLGMPKGRTSLC
jgi:predicted TIM-barrel fold metal-dependent hydrolase